MILRRRAILTSLNATATVGQLSRILLLLLVLASFDRHAAENHLAKSLRRYDSSIPKSRTLREQSLMARRPWRHAPASKTTRRTITTDILKKQTTRQRSHSHSIPQKTLVDALKLGFCGGLGGAVGTLVLFPLDSAKTLRQANPAKYPSVGHALWGLVHTSTSEATLPSTVSSAAAVSTTASSSTWHVGRAYRGILSSTLGAIPSSALYFGTYASVKRSLQHQLRQRLQSSENERRSPIDFSFPQRFLIHAAAAASGNLASSAIFVPKEVLKQKMQYTGQGLGATVASLYQAGSGSGILNEPALQLVASLYRGWQTTLLRNVPSAILRFCIYEELKRTMLVTASVPSGGRRRDDNARPIVTATTIPLRIFVAGAVAGALASGFMTPVDVLKTRVSTGTCPVDLPACVNLVVSEHGWKGLYAGAGSRMAFSGAFSAIGFGTYELAKVWMNVSDDGVDNEE